MPQCPGSSIRVPRQQETKRGARIKVIGVGGGGNNAINRMIESGMDGVEFVSANTDLQALRNSKAHVKLQLGTRLTRGLGTGAAPELGRRAAIEDADRIVDALEGADMVFVTAGLGGGTGTGAAPVVASLASQLGALTVAIVTRPFAFEGKRRMNQAERGIQELLDHADTLIVIPNEKLLAAAKNGGFFDSFHVADDVVRQAVQSISDIITVNGVINRDFADVRTTMAGMGYAVMGSATRTGPNRAAEAAIAAITSPLLEAGAIDGARGILINITGSSSLKLSEVSKASTIIQTAAHEDANIIFGAILDERLDGEVKITVIAAGFRDDCRNQAEHRLEMLNRADRPAAQLEEPATRRSDLPLAAGEEMFSPVARVVIDEVQGESLLGRAITVGAPSLRETATQGPFHEAHVQFPDLSFEDELLANIDGPAFDFTVAPDNALPAPQLEAATQPEIARLRQTAIAAYTVSSMIEAEGDAAEVSEPGSFAEILANREKILDLDLREMSDLGPSAPLIVWDNLENKSAEFLNQSGLHSSDAHGNGSGSLQKELQVATPSSSAFLDSPVFRNSILSRDMSPGEVNELDIPAFIRRRTEPDG